MNNLKKKLTLACGLLLLALVAIGCTPEAEPSLDSDASSSVGQAADEELAEAVEAGLEKASIAVADQLNNSSWKLMNMTGTERSIDLAAGEVTMTFADGKVSGLSGCNNYNTTYEVSADGELSISENIVMTRKLCADAANAVEAEFIKALKTATGLSEVDGNLVITTGAGEMVFEKG